MSCTRLGIASNRFSLTGHAMAFKCLLKYVYQCAKMFVMTMCVFDHFLGLLRFKNCYNSHRSKVLSRHKSNLQSLQQTQEQKLINPFNLYNKGFLCNKTFSDVSKANANLMIQRRMVGLCPPDVYCIYRDYCKRSSYADQHCYYLLQTIHVLLIVSLIRTDPVAQFALRSRIDHSRSTGTVYQRIHGR